MNRSDRFASQFSHSGAGKHVTRIFARWAAMKCPANPTMKAPQKPGESYPSWFLALALVCLISAAGPVRAQVVLPGADLINTVAGNGTAGYTGNNGAATQAELSNPLAVAVDSSGNIYIADNANNVIRKVTASTGVITTIAGTGTAGYSGDGGAATSAKLNGPAGVAVDSTGNIYISDVYNARIREVTKSTGMITTVAGNGTPGFAGDTGAATSAEINHPEMLAVDSVGNIYIPDSTNNRVRKVTVSTGIITTIVGDGTANSSGDGGLPTNAEVNQPYGIAFDSSGNIYIVEYAGNRVRCIDAVTGLINTVAGNGNSGFSGDGGPATSAEMYTPWGIAVDAAGDLFIADHGNSRIREVAASTGEITTYAGTGTQGYSGDNGPATSAEIFASTGVALDPGGNLYIADHDNNCIRAVGRVFLPTPGNIDTMAGNGTAGYAGDSGLSTLAQLSNPLDVAVDSFGNVYIADDGNNVIRKYTAATGIISTVAGNGTGGFSGDGGLATNANLNGPTAVAVDSIGNIYIADFYNYRIRKVAASTGNISTVAGNGTSGFAGDGGPAINAEIGHGEFVALDSANNIYISDASNNRIRKVTVSTGTITTIAGNGTAGSTGDGGPATSAELNSPYGLTLDSNNNVYVVESAGNRVREVLASTGIISTVAGNGTAGFTGDNGPAASAELHFPWGVAVDTAGNVYIADHSNSRIREVNATTQTITTIAGNGTPGYSGDGGLATSAEVNYATGVAVDSSRNIYIGDHDNNRVRVVGTGTPTPTITWATPATINYGTAISATQLDASASVGGTFAYTPASGTVPPAGPNLLSVTFTPTNLQAYNVAVASVTLNVNQATPTVTWNPPSAITYGTALSATQLNATASVQGSFVYTPPAGSILPAGSQTLSATFTPTSGNYSPLPIPPGTLSVPLTVNLATPTLTFDPIPAQVFGAAPFTVSASSASPGAVTYSVTSGPATVSGSTVTTTGAGTVVLSASQPATANYSAPSNASATFAVTKATPVITWAAPSSITSGTALSSTQLDASSSTAGSFVYTPASGTVLNAGIRTLSVTLTPTDTTDYTSVTKRVTIDVNPKTADGTDSGIITLTVNGTPVSSANYASAATPSSIAEALAANASTSIVTVAAVDDTLYLQAATTGSTTDYSYILQTASYDSTDFGQPSFVYPTITGKLGGGSDGNPGGQVYSYLPGYDSNGNITSVGDSVMGNWTYSYDTLNRLSTATAGTGVPTMYTNHYGCWTYDAFGNLESESMSTTLCSNSPTKVFWGQMDTANNNRFSSTSQATGGTPYDDSGNMTGDGLNQYLYDAEGRICAVSSSPVPGTTVMTGYLYDADGTRIAKGAITTWGSCDPTVNGFSVTHDYVLGPGGEEVSAIGMDSNGTMAWQHTNVYAGSELSATYDGDGLHFYFDDPLGTRRVQTDFAGVVEQNCASLPFGDQESCQPPPSGHLFAGKERDTESGNDYFGARYYGSSMGRWMSPDWAAKATPVPYAKLDNPQSLNLYAYVGNNPLSRVDPDGHCDAPSGLKPGQVGICVASYIRTTWFKLIGRGDGRDTNGNGGTARIETHLVVDPKTGKVTNQGDIVGRSGVLLKDVGPKGTGQSQNTQGTVDAQGNTHFQVSQDAHSFYAADGKFLGSIDNHLNLEVTPDQKVGIDAGSTARDFPSLEVYRYTTDGTTMTTTLVTNRYEAGNGDALKQPETPLPTQAPQ